MVVNDQIRALNAGSPNSSFGKQNRKLLMKMRKEILFVADLLDSFLHSQKVDNALDILSLIWGSQS